MNYHVCSGQYMGMQPLGKGSKYIVSFKCLWCSEEWNLEMDSETAHLARQTQKEIEGDDAE